MTKLTLLLCILFQLRLAQFESYYKPKECSKCRCYRIKCSRIEKYVDECEDEYKNSCDHPDDITDEDGCNIACGCCLEGQCYHWLHYYCLMFRSFEFFTAINFLAVSAHFFALIKLLIFFFFFKHKWNKTNLEENDQLEDLNEKKFFCSFDHFIFVKSNTTTFDKVPGKYLSLITELFDKIEGLKNLGTKNLVIYIIFCVLYLVQIILHFIVTFIGPEKPKFYGQICWVQHTILVVFWIFLWKSFTKKTGSYARSVIKILTQFEQKNKCTYRILPKNKIIEFNFDIKIQSEEEDDEDSDPDENKQLYPNEDNFDSIFEKDEEDKVKKNQIKPMKLGKDKKKKKKKGRSKSKGRHKSKGKKNCLLYTSPSPRDLSTSRMPSSA